MVPYSTLFLAGDHRDDADGGASRLRGDEPPHDADEPGHDDGGQLGAESAAQEPHTGAHGHLADHGSRAGARAGKTL